MTSYGALLLHVGVLTVPWMVVAVAASQYRARRTLSHLLFTIATVVVASLLLARFLAYCHSLMWVRSLPAEEVAAVSLAGRAVESPDGRAMLVAALHESSWYFRTGGLGQGRALELRLRSGERVAWRLYRDPTTGGAVILLWNGVGPSLGELFCAPLPKTARDVGVEID